VRAFGPGRINYHFGFSGPSFSIDTACSSSFAAIQLACTSLRAGECDTVFTGGMNVLTNPDIFSGLSKGQFLSKTGSCKTYDESADGYCRGDGVVTLILKRLDDAVAENDPILGVIGGIATNHSAEAISITHPHAGAQKFLFQKVMDEASIDVRAVNYVEMHGTGTQAGDGVEMDSVSSVFAPPASTKRMRRPDQPLFVGSVKSNVGHGEAVSGATALVKVLLMLQKNMIPPHCGIKTKINPAFPKDLNERQLQMAFRPTPFPKPANGPRYVFINNFSAAGGNTAMLLEDAPMKAELKNDPRSSHVIAISAKSLSSFKQNLKRLALWAADQTDSSLPSLAYTTTARRSHYVYRLAFEAKSMKQVRDTVAAASELARTPISSSKKPSIAFAFTGQGSHYIGMGKKLYQDVAQFRADLQDFDHIACDQGFPSFIGLIDGSINDMTNVSPIVTQLAITCSEIALANLWKSWGVTPSVVIGHSLGEYAALQIAGVLSVLDTILLVGHRAELLVSGCDIGSHGMLAVRASLASIEHLISHIPVERACINSPEDLVFSGTVDNIERLRETLSDNGIKTTKLNVPYAFHSAQVDPILDDFRALAKQVSFNAPQIPVISTYLGSVVSKPGVFSGEYLARHCRDTVNFVGGLSSAMQTGIISEDTVWLEVGPHPVCSNMIKSIIGKDTIAVSSLNRNDDPWKTIASSMSALYNAGLNIEWNEYHHDFNQSHKVLSLPSYAYDDKVYWIAYKENWTLTKGEKRQVTVAKSTLSTTSIQKIVKEQIDSNSAIVIGESDFAEPKLRTVIEGHQVNGAGLCPSTLYADMALTLCDYAFRTARPNAGAPHVNVGNMETHKPLVFNVDKNNPSQVIQIEAKLDFIKGRGVINYRSVMPDGKLVDQAQCDVTYEDSEAWSKDWERRKFLVQTRIDMLTAGGKGIHQIQRGLAYKLFAALVQYDDRFRGMEQVILNSEALEATANVAFQATKDDGNFFLSPYFIDSLCHITGFIMNANDAVDSYKQVYISHGWESLRFAKPIEADKRYRSYVRMQFVPGQGKMVAGDVYIFDGEEIVAVAGGVKFQCVPRTLLNTLLTPRSQAATEPKTQVQQQNAVQMKAQITQSKVSSVAKPSKKTKTVTKLEITTTTNTLTSKALDIIASEVGCDRSELVDAIDLSDLGVDSLMSLSISGRFREELELDFASSTFNDLPTIADLKSHLRQFETASDSPASSGMSTPDMVVSDTSDSEYSDYEEPEVQDLGKSSPPGRDSDLVHVIRSTIAEEMGVELEEISDNTDLSTMGMDSLMSLSILGALREKTSLTINSDLLVNNTSIDMIETSLGLRQVKARTSHKIPTSRAAVPAKAITQALSNKILDTTQYPPSQSILLQGNPKTATQTLFLLPDGSGSATSYTTLPDIAASDLAVYGLNCPFMKTPEEFTIGVVGVCQIYMKEIQRRQPKGPYLLGGWSAGGVLAYEMTRQFIAKGEKVSKLLLIDSPCPVKLEALPSTFHRFCDAIGLLGKPGAKIPSWLLPHFASAVRELTAYSDGLGNAEGIDYSKMPSTIAIWARDGIVTEANKHKLVWDMTERMPNSMYWLSNDRKDLGHNGWEKLVGAGNVSCMETSGNHFTMMRAPIVSPPGISHTNAFANNSVDN
jgi:iterative type I PKS product template protein